MISRDTEDTLGLIWLVIVIAVGGFGLLGGTPDWIHGWLGYWLS